MTEPDYDDHLAQLRRNYVEALPGQRLNIGLQRIRNPDHDPNRLIAYVSAVEGFARCIAMRNRTNKKAQLSALYPKYKNMGAEKLIAEYLAARKLKSPSDHFGSQTWKRFLYAVKYRNLLAHECTYLGLDISPALIAACEDVLRGLATTQGLSIDER